MNDHGFVSLGKYSSARDSILHYMCENGWANESCGDVESPVGYVWKISNDPADVHIPNTEVTSLLEDWFVANREVTDSPELRKELEGHFLVREDDRGFVGITRYVFAANRDEEYGRLQKVYDRWEGQQE